MSRRRRLLGARTRRKLRRRTYTTLAAAALLLWAWHTHPAALILTAVVAGSLYAAWRWLARGEPTDLYTHYFTTGEELYIGISNRYDLRCGQHEADKWWWLYVDPTKSTTQTWRNRDAAMRAEKRLIKKYCPIGNRQHNPRYAEQQPRRAALAARAAQYRGYGQPPPVITMPGPSITPRPAATPGRLPAGRGALTRRHAEWRPR